MKTCKVTYFGISGRSMLCTTSALVKDEARRKAFDTSSVNK